MIQRPQHLGARSPSSAMAVWVFGASKRSWGSAVPGEVEPQGTDTFRSFPGDRHSKVRSNFRWNRRGQTLFKASQGTDTFGFSPRSRERWNRRGQTLFEASQGTDTFGFSAPGSAEPQLRNGCLGFWSVKAELGLRGPGGGTAGGWNRRGQTLFKASQGTDTFGFCEGVFHRDVQFFERSTSM